MGADKLGLDKMGVDEMERRRIGMTLCLILDVFIFSFLITT